jgi:broad specificity phosphatase PhoE
VTTRVLLVRHGPSAHAAPPGLLDRPGIARWLADYDAAGITSDAQPPATLAVVARRARVVASSDMPRAIDSAARLVGSERGVVLSPLFREIPLPLPAWFPLRAPLTLWAMLIHLQWGIDIARSRDASPEAAERARRAAAWCQDACASAPGGDLVVVTHGVFRRLLARELRTRGWRTAGGWRDYSHWSVWAFTPPPNP